MDSALDQAIEFLITPTAPPPAAKAVVEALLRAEKTAKQTQVRYTYSQLLGTWRLGFITGTKRFASAGRGHFRSRTVSAFLGQDSSVLFPIRV